jgi:hypothetical protein
VSEAVKIKMVGDWSKTMGLTLGGAINATYELCGRSLAEACKHAIILMAQSARAMTSKSKTRRLIQRDVRLGGAEYVEAWKQGADKPVRLHKFRFGDAMRGSDRIPGTWDNAKKIGNSGLAKRSWMWGLAGLKGATVDSKAIPGVGSLRRILTDKVGGFILSNKLSYILKAMPPGWENEVRQRATNKIMEQAKIRLERAWVRTFKNAPPSTVVNKPDFGKYFLRAS